MSFDPTVRFAQALRRGFALAAGAPRVLALGVAAQLAAGLLCAAVAFALVSTLFATALDRAFVAALAPPGESGSVGFVGGPIVPLVGAAAVAGLLALALRLLWFCAAARTAAERLEGRPAPGPLAAAGARLERVLPLLVLLAPLGLAVVLYDGAALGATWLALARAQALRAFALGVASAAGLALASVVGFLLLYGFALVAKLALVSAVAGERGAFGALKNALHLLGTRLGTLVALELAFGALGLVPRLVASWGLAFAFGIGGGTESVALGGGAGVLAFALAALLAIFFATAEVAALAAIEADERGVLAPPPLPPRPAEVLATEFVAPTEPV